MTTIQIKVPNWLDKIFAWPLLAYRKHKYGLPFRKIPLGQGIFTIVDPDVFYLLNIFPWVARKDRCGIYAVRFDNGSDKRSKIVSMHRVIKNPPKGLVVDHKNHNTLDNTSSNLRNATYSQNLYNKKKIRSDTSARFVGVSFNKKHSKYIAYIRHEGKLLWLGSFDNEIDAAKAYDAAAKKYHGEFARLNFPDETLLHRLPLNIFIRGAKSSDLGKLIGA